MRSLCNVAYVAQAEHLDKDGLREFDLNLPLAPGTKPKRVSRGTADLLRAYDMAKQQR